MPQFRLLDAFRATFEGKRYEHRNSTLGDFVAVHLFEDLFEADLSRALHQRMGSGQRVVNLRNVRQGVLARRGDGSFGQIIPQTEIIHDEAFLVPRGKIATIEIGVEVKIFAKAQGKQMSRVKDVVANQITEFRKGGGAVHPICVAIVGINHADHYTSYEGDTPWPTDGSAKYRHPIQEAARVTKILTTEVLPQFDQWIILPYRATNVDPYPFEWVNYDKTTDDYGALLVRISREYEDRFNGHALKPVP